MNQYLKRNKLTKNAVIYSVLIWILALVGSAATAFFLNNWVEEGSKRAVERAIPIKDMGWIGVVADGFQVHLKGDAPDQLARLRVVEKVGEVVNVARIQNSIQAPEVALTKPETRVEIIQNDQVSSILGLMPKDPSPVKLYRALDAAQPTVKTLNLVEDNQTTADENWPQVLDYLTFIVSELPRMKLTATASEVKVDAIAQSPEEANELRKLLTSAAPSGIALELNISAPRPLIAPFQIKISRNGDELGVDQCSATHRSEIQQIQSVLRDGTEHSAKFANCALGLGAPSDNWGQVVATFVEQAEKADMYELSVSDNNVTIGISDQIPAELSEQIANQIRANLPPGFALDVNTLVTLRSIEDLKAEGGEVKLVIARKDEGVVEIGGVMNSTMAIESLNGFAVAKFGTEKVQFTANIVEGLPPTWEKNAFTLLQVIATMPEGQAILTQDQAVVEGKSESQAVIDGLEKILKAETSDVAISTKFEIIEVAKLKEDGASASECTEMLNLVLTESPIQFEPASAKISGVSDAVLARLGQVMFNCRSYSFEIGGHTDSSGADDVNLRISQERADAVLNALYSFALEYGPLAAKGYGEAEPIASNETEDGRARNRRIEIKLLEEESQ